MYGGVVYIRMSDIYIHIREYVVLYMFIYEHIYSDLSIYTQYILAYEYIYIYVLCVYTLICIYSFMSIYTQYIFLFMSIYTQYSIYEYIQNNIFSYMNICNVNTTYIMSTTYGLHYVWYAWLLHTGVLHNICSCMLIYCDVHTHIRVYIVCMCSHMSIHSYTSI